MRWRSPNNPLPLVVLVASEATWIALCVSALANTAPNFAMDLPYLLIVAPAALAVVIARAARVGRGPAALRFGLLAVMALLVIAFGAGLLGARTVPGAATAIALRPWSVTGRVPSAVTTIAWFVTALVVLRGIILGLSRGSFRQVGRSAAWTAIFFLTLFLVLALDSDPRLHAAARGAGALFVLFFLEVLAIGYLMRQREAAQVGITGPTGAERRMWGAILVVPLILVVGLGLLAAAALGAYGSGLTTALLDVGHALGTALRAIGLALIFALVHTVYGIAWVIGEIVGLFDHHAIGRNGPLHQPKTAKPPKVLPSPKVPAALGGVVALALVSGLVFMYLRYGPRRRRPPRVATPPQVLTSVFTWRHLFSLCFAALRRVLGRLFARLHRRRDARLVPPPPVGVRGEYVRVLVAARDIGRPRAPSETAREFALRLAPDLGSGGALLWGLTDRYEQSRYAGAEQAGGEGVESEELIRCLAALAEAGEDEAAAVAAPAAAP